MQRLYKFFTLAACTGLLLVTSACELDTVSDLNNPSVGSATSDATLAEIQGLVTGLESRNRNYYRNATELFGSLGRELWAYFGSDPRFLTDWIGKGLNGETYPDFFNSAGTFTSPYAAVKQANVLIEAANNSSSLSDDEKNAVNGFAKTIKGYQLIWPLMQQYQNGIRVDVDQPLNPGPTLGYDEALSEIRNIIDDGYSDLEAANGDLPYTLSEGWADFNSVDGLKEINRAIAARLALYAEDYGAALTSLQNSFMDKDVDEGSQDKMYIGPKHVYGNAPDINNPLYYPYDVATNTIIIVHPSVIEDLLPGDQRAMKFAERVNNPVTSPSVENADGNAIPGAWQDARWATATSPITFIRNEELILICAEASALTGGTDAAVDAINVIRNTWGLDDYSGSTDTDSLIEEILFQRRYSLWAESGHRWIDLRRTDRLNSDYVDLRDGGSIIDQISRRTSEINWDEQ